MNDNWKQCLTAGKRGEALVKAALDDAFCWVEDVADIYEYQRLDIDLIVDGITVEVKNDLRSNETNNIFVETYNTNNESRNCQGWYYYCSAQWMAFVQEQKGIIHFVDRKELWSIAPLYPVRNSYNSSGFCVPIAALEQCKTYKQMECEKVCLQEY